MKVTKDGVEIYIHDLNVMARIHFREAMGLEPGDDGNYDVFPIAIVPLPECQQAVGK